MARNKPDLFNVHDIAGTQPKRQNPLSGNRSVNPLEPTYQLPSYEIRPVTPPKFIKCPLDVSDIWGAQPSIPKTDLIATRDHINYNDIPGSTADDKSLKPKRRDPTILNSLNVTDINNSGVGNFKSQRVTDPLSPRYEFDISKCTDLVQDGSFGVEAGSCHTVKGVIGEIAGSHPKEGSRGRKSGPTDLPLSTSDIPGATTTKETPRRSYRDPNNIADIEGAQADTFKFFETRRQTNPLSPKYSLEEEVKPQAVSQEAYRNGLANGRHGNKRNETSKSDATIISFKNMPPMTRSTSSNSATKSRNRRSSSANSTRSSDDKTDSKGLKTRKTRRNSNTLEKAGSLTALGSGSWKEKERIRQIQEDIASVCSLE